MFSGIVEETSQVRSVVEGDGARRMEIDLGALGDRWPDLAPGASVAIFCRASPKLSPDFL